MSTVIVPRRDPKPGETCVCGRPAVRVLLLSSEVPQCAAAAAGGAR